MTTQPRDEDRERRISDEIIVDAYEPEEQAMGWWCYLDGHLSFPFRARCVAARSISPLDPGNEIVVTAMAPEEECEHEMFVTISWRHRPLSVPLAQLESIAPDPDTRRAIEDWQYWLGQGYDL